MLGRKELNSKPISLAEVKSILTERSKEPDFGYEQQTCLDYSNNFCKLKESDAKNLISELLKIDGMSEDAAIKITDILPLFKSTVQIILIKDKIVLEDEKIDSIIALVKKASENKIEPPKPVVVEEKATETNESEDADNTSD